MQEKKEDQERGYVRERLVLGRAIFFEVYRYRM